jgi:hypothetical protein
MHKILLALFFLFPHTFVLYGMVHDSKTLVNIKSTNLFKPIKLPYAECAPLTDEQQKKLTVVHEFGFSIIKKPGDELILLTPLCPCVGIGVKNLKSGVSWWGHCHYANSVTDAVTKIKEALGSGADSKDLAAFIFSRKKNADQWKKEGWWWRHRGRSHEEHARFIQSTLMQGLGISAEKIHYNLFEMPEDPDLPESSDAARQSILVDGTTDTNGILNAYSIFSGRLGQKDRAFSVDCFNFIKNSYGRLRMSPFMPGNIWWRYNTIQFTEIPKFNYNIIAELPAAEDNPFNSLGTTLEKAILFSEGIATILAFGLLFKIMLHMFTKAKIALSHVQY